MTAALAEPDDGDDEAAKLDGDNDQARVAERVRKGADLRVQGLTWQRIADELQYASAGAAYTAIMGHLRRLRDESLADMRDVESVALGRAAAAIWPQVLKGNARAQDTWLRNRQRYARLHGLDAPVQVAVSAGVLADVEDALAELEELYGEKDPTTVRGRVLESHEINPDEEERHG